MLPKIHQVHRPHPAFIFPALMGFPSPIQADGSHTQAVSSMSTVLTHPRGFSYMPAPSLHTFPRIPHTTKLQKIRPQIQRDLRYSLHKPSAGQVQQMLQTCEVGGAVTSCMRIPARTVMRTLSWARVRPWSYLHGYARIFTAMVMRIPARPWRKPIRRDQRTAQQIPNQPCQANTLKLRNASTNLQSNCYSKRLGGMGNDDAATPATPRGLLLHVIVGPDGPTIWHA